MFEILDHLSQLIGPPEKHHLNGVLLAGDDGQPLNAGLVAL